MDVSKVFDCTHVEERDLVSRYLTRKLSPEEAEAFEEHYFGCDRCWAEVQHATELRAALEEKGAGVRETSGQAVQSARVIRGPWRNWGLLAAAAGIAVAVGAGLFLASHRTTGIESLAGAASVAPHRSVEARLSGPFRYLPLQPATRGTTEPSLPLDLRRAALEAQKQAQDRPSAATLRASALGHLLTGEVDEAITQLEAARKLDPENVATLNDLAAAYLTRARQKSGTEEGGAAASDFEAALGAANAALEKDPKSPEALFNKALIVESQHLRQDAADAWRAYLEVDANSSWAAEARRHLERLQAPTDSELWERERKALDAGELDDANVGEVARRFPQQVRLFVQDDVLPKWAEAYLAGNRAGADSLLGWARHAARALQTASGDSLLGESVDAIDTALTKARSPEVAQQLARGHSLYGAARADYQKLTIASAATAFEASRALLASGESPFQAHASLGNVTCLLYQNALRPSLESLNGLVESEAPNVARHLSLLAQAHWYRGFVRYLLGYPHEALEEDGRALALFDRLEEKENSAAIHGRLSEDLQYVGEEDRFWMHLDRALALLDGLGTLPRRTVWLASAARSHAAAGHVKLAALFQGRLVADADASGKPDTLADALLSSAVTHYRGNRPDLAEEELIRARKALAAIPDADVRRRIEANLDLSEITLAGHGHSDGDVQRLTDALAFFEATSNHLAEAQLYLERGRMRSLRGDASGAQADFETGIQEFERQRGNLADENLRIQYFDTGRRLFESEIHLLAAKKDAERSFLYADRAHGRALLDDLRAIPGRSDSAVRRPIAEPLGREDLSRLVPDETAIVEFLMLPEEMITWVALPGRVEIVQAPIAEGRIPGLVRQLETAREDLGSSQTALGELHDILISPIAARIDDLPHLVFVPDRELNRVPFSALLDRKTGGYLIEKHDITIAPSAATFLHLRNRAPPADAEPSVLAIAGPPTAPLPGLRRLERVQEECRQVSSLYPRSLVLSGDRATRSSFRALASSYSVIHFAGHAVANPKRPTLSMLVLSPDQRIGDSGYLYSHEFSPREFGGVRLVVLGACSTAAGRASASEGVLGLARSVIATGVPSVVASLWPVDDVTTAALMAAFHARLQAGDSTSAALRSAQLGLLKGDGLGDPLSSTAFQVYGASVTVTSERRNG